MKHTLSLLSLATLSTFSTASFATNNANQITSSLPVLMAVSMDIETIQIKGQIDSLILSEEIDLTASSSPDMRKQLSLLPGVDINSNGMVTGIIQYRGLFSDRVRVSIDDMLIAGAGPNAMDSPLSQVTGAQGQTITVFAGVAPVSIGAETLGGAIDISDMPVNFTNKTKYSFENFASLGWFSNDGESIHAKLQGVNKNSYVSVNVDYQTADNYEAGNSTLIPSTFYDRYSVKLKGGYQRGKHNFNASATVRNTNESGTPTLAMDIIFIDSYVAQVNYEYDISDTWSLSTKLYGNNNYHDMNNFSLRPNANLQMHRLNSVDSQGRGMDVVLINEQSSLVSEFGLHAESRVHNSFISNPNNLMFFIDNFNEVERNLTSIYGQIKNTESEKTVGFIDSWELGVRFSNVHADADIVGTNMTTMNPNVRALTDAFNSANRQRNFTLIDLVGKFSVDISDTFSVQVSAGIKERAPSYQQLYSWFPLGVSAGLADGRNYIGNLDLTHETANKVDFSAYIRGNNWVFIPSVYYSDIDNYIIGMPSENLAANMIAMMQQVQAPLVWENQDARLSGFDLSYKYQFSDNLNFKLVSQYVRGKQIGEIEQSLYRLAPFTTSLTVNYQFKSYEFNLISRLVSAQNKIASIQNETSTSGYGLLDLHMSYEFNRDLRATFIVENLFDKTYANHLAGFNRVGQSDLPIGEKVLGVGRNVGAYLTYVF